MLGDMEKTDMINLKPHQMAGLKDLVLYGDGVVTDMFVEKYGVFVASGVQDMAAEIIEDPETLITISPRAEGLCGLACENEHPGCGRDASSTLMELRILAHALGEWEFGDVVMPANQAFELNWSGRGQNF